MLFPSGGAIDFSVVLPACLVSVPTLCPRISQQAGYPQSQYNTPINMSPPVPHAEHPLPDCEAALEGQSRTAWAVRWAPSVISRPGWGRSPHAQSVVGSRQHSGAGGGAASS